MGYYDYQPTNTKRSFSAFFSGLIGVLIGAALMFIFLTFNRAELGETEKISAANAEEAIPAATETVREVYKSEIHTAIQEAVEKVSDAVVGVTNIRRTQSFWTDNLEAGTGSGVIYKKVSDAAFVITNYHVIEGANNVEVTLTNGEKVPAEIVGTDIYTDLAVLKIDGAHVETVAQLGAPGEVRLGEPVIAIGNPLGMQFSGSVTQGIISGTERTIPVDLNRDGQADWQADVIQTDAAINPGNSGGALVNIKGEVIGINSMKIAQGSVEGIGLSIPMSVVIPTVEDLELYGEVRRPVMGIELRNINTIPGYYLQGELNLPKDVTQGIIVLDVVQGSPSAKAGLQRYDVIVALDGVEMKNDIDLRRYLYNEKEINDTLQVTFYRDGKKHTVEMILSSYNNY